MSTETRGPDRSQEVIPVVSLVSPLLLLYFAALQLISYKNLPATFVLVILAIASSLTRRA